MYKCNIKYYLYMYRIQFTYICLWAQSTGRILSHHRRSGNCAGRSIKRGSALGLCRGNLQCWTSLPVYYQVVYFTVAMSVCAFRDLSLPPSHPCLPSTCPTTDAWFISFSFFIVSLFLFSRDASTGTYWTTLVLLPCFQWPAAAFLLSSLPRGLLLALRSDRILDGFSSSLRIVLLVLYYVATRRTHCAYSCKLRSSNRIRRNDWRDYLRTLFRWLPSCPRLSCSRRTSGSASWKSIKARKKP